MSKLYILVGLPGAGKTTYCNTKLSKCECISPSSTLATLRKCGENASYSDAFHTACLEMNKALSSRRDVVFDATNITKKERTEILAYKPHNTVTVAIYFPAPAEPCINRNRGRRCVLPEAVVKKMAECLEFPTYDEMLDSIIVTGTDPNRKVFAS